MKIAVIGAGALGCLFGGRLTEQGHDVTLIHYRQPYVDQLNENGLSLEELDGTVTDIPVTATTDAATVGHADLAMVFVKSHQTEAALEEHGACIGPETDVLSLQNGIRHYDRLIEFTDEQRAFAGVTYESAAVESPGYVRVTSTGNSTLGGVDTETAQLIGETLREAGFSNRVVDEPRRYIWGKQLVSMPIKPLAALTRLPNGELIADDGTRELMRQVVAEAERVADARGIDLPIDDPMAEVIATCENAADHHSSMVQDIWAERKTEIDEVNGAVVDIAGEEGIAVPTNELLTELVRGLERSYLD